jgi:tetratricopeptide (TPR) repeat protein
LNPQIAKLIQHGFTLLQNGRLLEAKEVFENILSVEPLNEHGLNLLGVVLVQRKEAQQAVDVLEKALSVNNKNGQTYNNLGLALKELNQFQKAQAAFNASLSISPQQPQALNNLGNVLAAQNLHKQAIAAFEAALKLEPNYPECLSNFAQSLKELGNLQLAFKAIEHANTLVPNNSYFLNVKGEIQLAKVEYENAQQTFEKAILVDNYIPARINLSTALKQLGNFETAKQCLQLVIKDEPNNTEAHNHLGVLQEQLGEFDAAAESFRSALEYTPNHASSFYQLAKLKNHRLTAEEVGRINELLADAATLSVFKSSLFFALAVHYDKTKQYSLAINNYTFAKQIKATKSPYNPQLTEQYRAALEGMQSFPSAHVCMVNVHPIFIIGMPRSGTSLTEQILASHSKVFGAGELGYINDLVKKAEKLTNAPYPQCMSQLNTHQLTELGSDYKKRMLKTFGEHAFFTDKNPLNYNFVGFIKAILPDAKFIYCQRDAVDNCLSIFKLPFDDSQGYAHDLIALGHYYREHEKLMAFWRHSFHDDIIVSQYEEVVEDQPKETARLLKFLGLDYEQATERFFQTQRIVMTPSAEQVRQPIYKTSINNWQKYGEAVQPLLKALNVHRANQ